MTKIPLCQGIATLVLLAAVSGCSSAGDQHLSADMQSVDQQQDAQNKLIDDRTAELKRDIEIHATQSITLLKAKGREQGVDQRKVDKAIANVQHNSDLAKANLDHQNEICKKTVEGNVKVLKAQLDSYAKTHKYQ